MRSFALVAWLLLLLPVSPSFGEGSAHERVQTDSAAAKLFRLRCLRCHDLRMATRPVRPDAADSLVHTMRRYDPRWIKPEEIPALIKHVRALQARRISSIQSQSERSTP
ncbi:MAG TPA: hypothetical protein VNL69_07255 [Bacteroidota bacterium]|nr:hypothetical protein [Bacteroidota bacterium]